MTKRPKFNKVPPNSVEGRIMKSGDRELKQRYRDWQALVAKDQAAMERWYRRECLG